MIFKFELRDILKERITGYKGVVMGRTQYATGCNHYGLVSQTLKKDGTIRDWEWFDETRLEKIGKNVWKKSVKPTSGIFPNPPKM